MTQDSAWIEIAESCGGVRVILVRLYYVFIDSSSVPCVDLVFFYNHFIQHFAHSILDYKAS